MPLFSEIQSVKSTRNGDFKMEIVRSDDCDCENGQWFDSLDVKWRVKLSLLAWV